MSSAGSPPSPPWESPQSLPLGRLLVPSSHPRMTAVLILPRVGSRVPYWGVPCPLLGWSLLRVAPSLTWAGRTLRARFPARGGERGVACPEVALQPRGVAVSLSPTWGAGAGPYVRSAGAAGAAGRQNRPASPPLPPSSSSSSTSLPPPPCLPHSPRRRKRGVYVLRLPHSPPDCPTLPKVLQVCPVSPQGAP